MTKKAQHGKPIFKTNIYIERVQTGKRKIKNCSYNPI